MYTFNFTTMLLSIYKKWGNEPKLHLDGIIHLHKKHWGIEPIYINAEKTMHDKTNPFQKPP